jgi:hypothetical protein
MFDMLGMKLNAAKCGILTVNDLPPEILLGNEVVPNLSEYSYSYLGVSAKAQSWLRML